MKRDSKVFPKLQAAVNTQWVALFGVEKLPQLTVNSSLLISSYSEEEKGQGLYMCFTFIPIFTLRFTFILYRWKP